MIARESIILDEHAINDSSNTPALDPLEVSSTIPSVIHETRRGFIKDQEQMANSERNVPEVVHARCLSVPLEEDDGTDRFMINRKRLKKLVKAGKRF